MDKTTPEKILKAHVLKITKGRVAVLGLLIDSGEPLPVDAISEKLEIKINQSTLYRMLEIFVAKNILYQTDFRQGKAYFEYQKHHHHHVICRTCGKKEEVDICNVAEIRPELKDDSIFKTIESHSLEFFSLCHTCQK